MGRQMPEKCGDCGRILDGGDFYDADEVQGPCDECHNFDAEYNGCLTSLMNKRDALKAQNAELLEAGMEVIREHRALLECGDAGGSLAIDALEQAIAKAKGE